MCWTRAIRGGAKWGFTLIAAAFTAASLATLWVGFMFARATCSFLVGACSCNCQFALNEHIVFYERFERVRRGQFPGTPPMLVSWQRRAMGNAEVLNVRFSLAVPALLLLAPAVVLWGPELRAARRSRKGRCPRCGYDRRGLVMDAPCPECGATASST